MGCDEKLPVCPQTDYISATNGFTLGMVKRSRIRFPGMMGTVDVPSAATRIVTNMRRRAAIVFIPDILYYISNIVRILPAKVQLLLTDFFDTGIDVSDDVMMGKE